MSTHHINGAFQPDPARITPVRHGLVCKLLAGANNQVLHNILVTHTQAVHLFPFSADRLLTATVVVDDPKEDGSVGATLTRDQVTGFAVWSSARSNTARITATASLSGDLVPYKLACSRGCTVTTNAVVSGALSARFRVEPGAGEVRLSPVLFDISGVRAVSQTGTATVSVSGEVFSTSRVQGLPRKRRVRALKTERDVTPANYLPL